jgi:hypothetical protein
MALKGQDRNFQDDLEKTVSAGGLLLVETAAF